MAETWNDPRAQSMMDTLDAQAARIAELEQRNAKLQAERAPLQAVADAARAMNDTFEHSRTLAPDERGDDIKAMVMQRITLAAALAALGTQEAPHAE